MKASKRFVNRAKSGTKAATAKVRQSAARARTEAKRRPRAKAGRAERIA